jgi:hypothetical protein
MAPLAQNGLDDRLTAERVASRGIDLSASVPECDSDIWTSLIALIPKMQNSPSSRTVHFKAKRFDDVGAGRS